jgi:hypothetical protein
MLQLFYAMIITLFEQSAACGLLVSGLNSEGVLEKMIAFPRLLNYDADNETFWDMSGSRKCWQCDVRQQDLHLSHVKCGQAPHCVEFSSDLFHIYRDAALIRFV